MKKTYDHIELLAPAGSYEALQAAIHAGCDAIYFGLGGFNMRANTSQAFTLEDLKQIAHICHEAHVRCYLALNTLIYDGQIEEMKKVIDAVKENDVDAIITFDTSAISYARECGVEVHLSTQHSVSNIEAVKFFSTVADRIVLARELTLEQIKQITHEIEQQKVCGPSGRLMEIEIFIHGAMCVAVSGRCGMSLYMFGTSANCGECSQPCRRAFTVTDKSTGKQLDIENEYVMSTEDLCTIGMLDEILDSGAVSLKIEGRGRAPEYVDEVVRCYREAIDAIREGTYTKEKIAQWNTRLSSVFNRGLSEGFYRGEAFKHWSGEANSRATQKRIYVGMVTHYYPKQSIAEISVQADDLTDGQECLITGTTTGVLRCKAEKMMIDEQTVSNAKQGDCVTLVVPGRVRAKDKLYKLVPTK
ncbi:U32 family peptidase [Candidatus Uhrbacteria bacterium]|nr:U32 family peptidase [Candidatus Uhrbacteria bacterium]